MEFIVVSFRSRSETIKFSEYLKKNGVNNDIISTPKEAGVGCGLSIKITKDKYPLIKRILSVTKVNSFAGFFLVTNLGGKRIVRYL